MTPKVKPGYGWKVTVKKVYPKAFCLTSHGVHAIAVDSADGTKQSLMRGRTPPAVSRGSGNDRADDS
jgi:hypothetical protein